MIPDENPETDLPEPNITYWTWDDFISEDGEMGRRVIYLRQNDTLPQILTSPIPEILAEWGTPSIDGIESERANVCDVVNLMWINGLMGDTNSLTPIQYMPYDDFYMIVESRTELDVPKILDLLNQLATKILESNVFEFFKPIDKALGKPSRALSDAGFIYQSLASLLRDGVNIFDYEFGKYVAVKLDGEIILAPYNHSPVSIYVDNTDLYVMPLETVKATQKMRESGCTFPHDVFSEDHTPFWVKQANVKAWWEK